MKSARLVETPVVDVISGRTGGPARSAVQIIILLRSGIPGRLLVSNDKYVHENFLVTILKSNTFRRAINTILVSF
jgi:hypothetical protein